MLRVGYCPVIIQEIAMRRPIDPSEIPEEVARFAEAQVAAGRFASVGDVLRAGKEALEQSEAIEAERARLLRAAWDEGMESLRLHGPQLESDDEFDSFMDEAEAEALRQ
jgi:Arc/MetJ-type ribon-helix-helix transcriptional regulator